MKSNMNKRNKGLHYNARAQSEHNINFQFLHFYGLNTDTMTNDGEFQNTIYALVMDFI